LTGVREPHYSRHLIKKNEHIISFENIVVIKLRQLRDSSQQQYSRK